MKPSRIALFGSCSRFGLLLAFGALFTSAALAQTPAPAVDNRITTTPAKTQKASDLAARYRFLERYITDDENTVPGVVASYRTAIIEVMKESIDSSKGAPRRTEITRHAIFTERPAEMNANNVSAVARTYERFKVKPVETPGYTGEPLEGLSVLVRNRLAELPQIQCLTENRSLTEFEYDTIAHQMFIPQISLLVPVQVVRIGDTWKVSRRAAQALLGDPLIAGDGLVAKLIEVRKEVDGPRSVAVIEISGKLSTPAGDSTVNAQVVFTFIGESSLKGFKNRDVFPPPPKDDVTESRGSITEVRLARLTSGPIPGPGRLRYQLNREVTMHRQIGLVEGAPLPPKLKMIPDPSVATTWLTHVDPDFKFSLQHPQDLLPPDRSLSIPESKILFLMRNNREGRDMLQVEFVPKSLTPEDLKKLMAEKYEAFKTEVLKGNEVWLPEADWALSKMKVHRVDAEVKLADPKVAATAGTPRVHFDGYLILFGQSSSIIAISSTTRDAVGPYRKEIEQILKSIKLDPPKTAVN